MSGQRALFACLQPEAIGVTLNASCLMDPLKSVSGVLAAGPADIHRFAPGYRVLRGLQDQGLRGPRAEVADSRIRGMTSEILEDA